jgi:hypothetical protein
MHFSLSDLVCDIAQNACEAGSSHVLIRIGEDDSRYEFSVEDDGKGMTADELKRAVDPFVTDGIKHPGRKVGLGLPFLIQMAEQAGGGWDIRSEKGRGTTVSAWFACDHPDLPPEGDVPALFRSVLMFGGPSEVEIRRFRRKAGKPSLDYELRRSELVDALGPLDEAGSLILLGEYLRSLEED